MIHESRFVVSHRPYAVRLASFRVIIPGSTDTDWTWARVDAVWFRRRKGLTVACVGHLRDLQRPAPVDAVEFLTRHDDGRYGGDCEGRWDGERYWGAQEPAVIEQHLGLLRPMLDAFPAVPDGYEGWWRF